MRLSYKGLSLHTATERTTVHNIYAILFSYCICSDPQMVRQILIAKTYPLKQHVTL
jgi:hypothetical protein